MIRSCVRWLVVAAVAAAAAGGAAAQEKRVLAIEIGSKGVKPVVATLDVATQKVKVESRKNNNATVLAGVKDGELDAGSIATTVDAVTQMVKQLAPDVTADGEILVVVSSGVVGKVKEASLASLGKQVEEAVKGAVANKVRVTSIQYDDEVRYTLHSILRHPELDLPPEQADVFVFDIGSGNTKFGYLTAEKGKLVIKPGVNSGEVKYGTTVLQPLVKADGTRDPAFDETFRKVKAELDAILKTLPGKGKKVYLTGGAPYVAAAHKLYAADPKQTLQGVKTVELTEADADRFIDTPKNVLAAAEPVFDVPGRIVAGHLLKASIQALTDAYGESKLQFINSADKFWIEGLVRETLGDTLTAKAEPAPAAPAAVVPAPTAPAAAGPKVDDLLRKIQVLEDRVRTLEGEAVALRKKTAGGDAKPADGTPKAVAPADAPAARRWAVVNEQAAADNFRRGVARLEKLDYRTAGEHFKAAVADNEVEPSYWYALALTQLAAADRAAAAASAETYWALNDRGASTSFGDTFINVQGPPRTAVEDLLTEVRDNQLRAARRAKAK